MTDSSPASGIVPTPEAGDAGRVPSGSGGAGPAEVVGQVDRLDAAEPMDFAKTLNEYEAKLMRYAAMLLGRGGASGHGPGDAGNRGAQAGDLVQEAFLRLHRYCREHGSTAIKHPGTWLYRVVHNLAMDTIRQGIRQRGAQTRMEDDARQRVAAADASDEAALGQLEQRELVALAMRLLGDLPEQQQQVITLKFLEGLTLRQIAEVVDSSPGSVSYHLNQGLSRLAQQLRKKGLL